MISVKTPDDKIWQYLYQPNSFVPLVQIHNQRLRYIITDQIGTPRELLTANGQVAWYAYKEVAGMFYQSHCKVDEPSDHSSPQRYIQGEEACDLRYQGQLHDNESGLYYNRFRYFDPDANQYLTPDPIGLAGGIRPQGYVKNPLSWVDPLGLLVFDPGHNDLFPGHTSVKITMQGTRQRDNTAAFKAAGIKRADAKGYTWHHVDDFNSKTGEVTMQLVKTDGDHSKYHKGGVWQFKRKLGIDYDTQKAVAHCNKKGWLTGKPPKKSKT